MNLSPPKSCAWVYHWPAIQRKTRPRGGVRNEFGRTKCFGKFRLARFRCLNAPGETGKRILLGSVNAANTPTQKRKTGSQRWRSSARDAEKLGCGLRSISGAQRTRGSYQFQIFAGDPHPVHTLAATRRRRARMIGESTLATHSIPTFLALRVLAMLW